MFRNLRDLAAESFDTAFASPESHRYVSRVINISGLGPVRLGQVFAEGGFSFVHKAELLSGPSERPLAVKRISAAEPDAMRRAKAEADMLASLPKHEHIVGYYGAAFEGEDVFLAFELVDGGTLPDYLDRRRARGQLPADDALEIFSHVCAAVVALHSQDPPIACRDLKLENVLYDAEKRCFKLCDFGSCTTVAKRYTNRREILAAEDEIREHSTAMYRAPEMCDLYAKPFICELVDVWALGCVFYGILFGDLPFDGQSTVPILEGRVKYPASSTYPESFVKLLKAMLTASPEKRVDSFTVMEAVLRLRGLQMDGGLRVLGAKLRDRRKREMAGGAFSAARDSALATGTSSSPPAAASSNPLSHSTSGPRVPPSATDSTRSVSVQDEGSDDFFSGAFVGRDAGSSSAAAVSASSQQPTGPALRGLATPVTSSVGPGFQAFAASGNTGSKGSENDDDDDDWAAFDTAEQPQVTAPAMVRPATTAATAAPPRASAAGAVPLRPQAPAPKQIDLSALLGDTPPLTAHPPSAAPLAEARKSAPEREQEFNLELLGASLETVTRDANLAAPVEAPARSKTAASGPNVAKAARKNDADDMFSDLLPPGFGRF